MSPDKTVYSENIETQVVVIGGGGAGLAAAVAAAERGADVILLEKAAKPGGNSAMASGIFAAESPVQQRMNIDAPKKLFFRLAMDFAHWTINPRLVHALIDKSGDTIRWLEEKGVNFELRGEVRTYFNLQIPLAWHCPKNRGRELIEALVKNFESLGGRLLCNIGGKGLMTSAGNAVTGVVATTVGGGEVKVKADSVIIATGGFGGNKEMMKKYCPEYRENMHFLGFPNMGEGIVMAMKVGAASEGMGMLQSEANVFAGEPKKLRRLTTEPNMVWVNKWGERFTDESVHAGSYNIHENAHVVGRQPEGVCFTLLDEKIKQNIMGGSGLIVSYGPLTPPGKMPEAGEFLQSAAGRGDVKIADSWDEIAKWIGTKPETLKATIDEYNSFCDQGYDAAFDKEVEYLVPLRTPPYYAIRCVVGFDSTMGGIKINHNMEVVDKNDNPIPGLYAAGIDTGGWGPETYNELVTASSFGFAVNGGRIAGENAFKYVQNK